MGKWAKFGDHNNNNYIVETHITYAHHHICVNQLHVFGFCLGQVPMQRFEPGGERRKPVVILLKKRIPAVVLQSQLLYALGNKPNFPYIRDSISE